MIADNEMLDKLEALARAATPGPWTHDAEDNIIYPESGGNLIEVSCRSLVVSIGQRDKNAAFIAAANPATVLDLIALARRAAPAQVEAAPQAEPPKGFALMPLYPNAEMHRVIAEDEWKWEDLLAAACAITEDQYNDIATHPDDPMGAEGAQQQTGPNMYRKTALVQAEQFLPAEGMIPAGVISDGHGDPRTDARFSFVLHTLEGLHHLRDGDYICTGPAGEKWNVERGIFESTYEPVAPTESAAAPAEQTQAALDVLAERRRQIEQEGCAPERDDRLYRTGALSRAGGLYAMYAHEPLNLLKTHAPPEWPWDESWWKPGPARRNLVKAAALILADIERLDRKTSPEDDGSGREWNGYAHFCPAPATLATHQPSPREGK